MVPHCSSVRLHATVLRPMGEWSCTVFRIDCTESGAGEVPRVLCRVQGAGLTHCLTTKPHGANWRHGKRELKGLPPQNLRLCFRLMELNWFFMLCSPSSPVRGRKHNVQTCTLLQWEMDVNLRSFWGVQFWNLDKTWDFSCGRYLMCLVQVTTRKGIPVIREISQFAVSWNPWLKDYYQSWAISLLIQDQILGLYDDDVPFCFVWLSNVISYFCVNLQGVEKWRFWKYIHLWRIK